MNADWRWDNEKTTYNRLCPLRESNGQVVCYAPEFPTKEHLALIAAAPELLEACREMWTIAETEYAHLAAQQAVEEGSFLHKDRQRLDRARAVIAKAEGDIG